MHHDTDFHVIQKSLAIWALIIPLAIANGYMRTRILEPLTANYALPLSGLALCAMILVLCWCLVPRLGTTNQKTYIVMGTCWAVLAAGVECAMGRFILNTSWRELMAAYNPAHGNLWLLVLVCTAISPWLSARMHAQTAAGNQPQETQQTPQTGKSNEQIR